MVKRIRVRVLENQTLTDRESGRENMCVRGGEKYCRESDGCSLCIDDLCCLCLIG